MKYDKLIEQAGVLDLVKDIEAGLKGQFLIDEDFDSLLRTIRLIQTAKRYQYEDYIEARDPDPKIALFENFTDLKRKYVRLNVAIKRKYSFNDLAEGYLDIAIYGLLGLQLLFHIEEKKDVPGSK